VAGVILALGGCNAILGYTADFELAEDASAEDATQDVSGDSASREDGAADAPSSPSTDALADALDDASSEGPLRAPDAAMPDSASEDAADTGTDADAGADADADADAVVASVTCGGGLICTGSEGCCFKFGLVLALSCTSPLACTGEGFAMCDGPEDCPADQVCCTTREPDGGFLAECVDASMCTGGVACHAVTPTCNCIPPGRGCPPIPSCGGTCGP
jgi:hypothetical protein